MKACVVVALQFVLVGNIHSWDDAGSVLLRDVQAVTLYRDRYTTARRSSPVPQLQCIGGSAGCKAFVPEVVQCQNRGWDGMDVQWECKTDMDNTYRFGRIEMSCEGYNHPDDAYILKGSCGLEYTLELTGEGRRNTGGSWGSYTGSKGSGGLQGLASTFFNMFFGNKHQHHKQSHHSSQHPTDGEGSGSLLVPLVLLALAYGVYKLFLSGGMGRMGQQWGQAGYPGDNQSGSNPGPPPPGFKPDYTGSPGASPGYGFHSDYTHGQQHPGGRAASGTGGGFWTGMGTGGLLGYLFGRQRSQPYHSNYSNYSTYSSSRPYSAGASSSSSSSGTRTASGFGGTKRR